MLTAQVLARDRRLLSAALTCFVRAVFRWQRGQARARGLVGASLGTGADLMKRIAAPMVGGLATSFALELLVYPAVYVLWRRRGLRPGPATPEASSHPQVG